MALLLGGCLVFFLLLCVLLFPHLPAASGEIAEGGAERLSDSTGAPAARTGQGEAQAAQAELSSSELLVRSLGPPSSLRMGADHGRAAWLRWMAELSLKDTTEMGE